jgi:hypothetical protein
MKTDKSLAAGRLVGMVLAPVIGLGVVLLAGWVKLEQWLGVSPKSNDPATRHHRSRE